jgi:hypothetical protein
MSSSELAAHLAARLATTAPQDADALLVTAELLKEAGDYRTYDYYEMAIAANPDEPAYERSWQITWVVEESARHNQLRRGQ